MLMYNVITLVTAYFASIFSCLLFSDLHSCMCKMSEARSSTQTAGEPGPPSKRHKDDGSVRQYTQQKPSCIIHIPGLQYGPLQLLSASKDADSKLAGLKEVCKQRLSLSLNLWVRSTR